MKTTTFRVLVLAILGLALGLHLVFIQSSPWDWDEPLYTHIVSNVVSEGYPHVGYGNDLGDWFAFHPPFHFYLMGQWYQLVGQQSVATGRLLSSLIATAVVAIAMANAWLVTKNRSVVLLVGFLLALDGWFGYTSLLVKFDTAAALIGTAGMALFILALQRDRLILGFLAGLVVGGAVIYKHVAIIFVIAVIVHWLLLRGGRTRIHLVVGIGIGLSILAYIIGMVVLVGDPFVEATLVQIRRSLGLQEARGLSYGIDTAIAALVETYLAFLGTVGLLVIAGLISLKKAWDHLVSRQELERTVITAWALGAGAVLAFLQLRNPHYLVYLIIPCTLLVGIQLALGWSELRWRRVIQGVLVVLVLLNLGTIFIRATQVSRVNALAEIQAQLETLPADAILLSEETVCSMAQQECYKFGNYQSQANLDRIQPDYVIVYTTTTHAPPDTEALNALIDSGTEIYSVQGWKETIRILAISR